MANISNAKGLLDNLSHRWTSLVHRDLRTDQILSDKWFHIVSTRYQEPQRHYHTLSHLDELFGFYDEFKSKLNDPIVCALSIWFHDVIYDPKRNDNELESVKLFEQFSMETKQHNDLTKKVTEYILCTIDHKPKTNDSDLRYFMDFDVAILGKPWPGACECNLPDLWRLYWRFHHNIALRDDRHRYSSYADQIRQEYIHYPDEAYKKGRTSVLKKLGEGSIFHTPEFKERFEAVAKKNLEEEIKKLNS